MHADWIKAKRGRRQAHQVTISQFVPQGEGGRAPGVTPETATLRWRKYVYQDDIQGTPRRVGGNISQTVAAIAENYSVAGRRPPGCTKDRPGEEETYAKYDDSFIFKTG